MPHRSPPAQLLTSKGRARSLSSSVFCSGTCRKPEFQQGSAPARRAGQPQADSRCQNGAGRSRSHRLPDRGRQELPDRASSTLRAAARSPNACSSPSGNRQVGRAAPRLEGRALEMRLSQARAGYLTAIEAGRSRHRFRDATPSGWPGSTALAATLPNGRAMAAAKVRIGVLKFGTVSWELDTLKHHGFDAANGIELDVVNFAGEDATNVALQAGEVDVIVSDWLWVSRLRSEGERPHSRPYSTAVGAVMVKQDSPIGTIADLEGQEDRRCRRPAGQELAADPGACQAGSRPRPRRQQRDRLRRAAADVGKGD